LVKIAHASVVWNEDESRRQFADDIDSDEARFENKVLFTGWFISSKVWAERLGNTDVHIAIKI